MLSTNLLHFGIIACYIVQLSTTDQRIDRIGGVALLRIKGLKSVGLVLGWGDEKELYLGFVVQNYYHF